jgi:hypothetical protein
VEHFARATLRRGTGSVKVLGIKCSKDQLQWVLLSGDSRTDATVVEHQEPQAPAADRGQQLLWARKELLEVLARTAPDVVSLRVAEAGQSAAASFGRVEMDGVAQAALAEAGYVTRRCRSSTLRGLFKVKNGIELKGVTNKLAAVTSSTKSRRDQVLGALAEFPAP